MSNHTLIQISIDFINFDGAQLMNIFNFWRIIEQKLDIVSTNWIYFLYFFSFFLTKNIFISPKVLTCYLRDILFLHFIFGLVVNIYNWLYLGCTGGEVITDLSLLIETGKMQEHLQLGEDEFKKIMKINFMAPWFLLNAVGKRMREYKSGGSIVLLTSIIGSPRGLYPGAAAYGSCSAGLQQLVRVSLLLYYISSLLHLQCIYYIILLLVGSSA